LIKLTKKLLVVTKKFKLGDFVSILLFILLILISIHFFWNFPQGQYLKIQKNDEVLGIYSLNQTDIHTVHNLIGDSEIIIENGKARFSKSPCKKQYCIHQGWINKINQIVICMPNQISISIIGDKENYDAINY
jgi:hypothetical protein